jgi:hypothetical protein
LEPAQADLLNRICEGKLLGTEQLEAAGAFGLSNGVKAPNRNGKADP